MKKEWENAEMYVIVLEENDIIITSTNTSTNKDPGEFEEED